MKIVKFLKLLLLFFVVVYVGIVVFIFYKEDSMIFGGTALSNEWGAVPADTISIPWDTLWIKAEDQVPVFLVESKIKNKDDAPWVIFFHGNGTLVASPGNLERYRMLQKAGYNVLAVEYRGYGMSSTGTKPSEEGVYADGRAGWNYLTEEVGVAPHRIVIYGFSLGSGIATYLASQLNPGGLITEGAYTELPAVGQEIYPWLPISLIMRNRFPNLERAKSLSLPWLMFHSSNDEVIPFSHGQSLKSAAKDVYFVELNSSHSGGIIKNKNLAMSALQKFAEKLK